MTDKDILKGIGDIKSTLKALETLPVGSVRPQHMFGGFGQAPQGPNGWPTDQLKSMEPYGYQQLQMMSKGKGQRLSGMGPMLVKLACLSGNPEAIQIAKSQGLWEDGYTQEKFEKEHQFVSMSKACTSGLPWTKTVSGQVRKTSALAENAGITGGYILPPQYQNELLTIAAEDGFIEQRAKVVPMTSRTVQWPMLDITTVQASGVTPYLGGIVGTWQPEAATIAQTQPQFRQSDWTAWDLLLFCVSSNQLLADNGIGLDAMLTQLFGQAITWYKEYAFLQGLGAGSSMPLGVKNAPATYVQNRPTPGAFKFQDAAAMLSRLQVRSWDSACWMMHQSVLPQLIQMVDNNSSNRLVWVGPMGDSSKNMGPAAMKLPSAFLNGLPIFFTEKLPSLGTKGDVMLVDWSQYVIGMRLDLQIDVSPHYLFQTNQMAWRVIARCDGKPWLNAPITDAAGFQISPMVCLN